MVKFLDGPAAGVELRLFRTPVMLRVVRSAGGTWDALDQLADTPAPREAIFLYELTNTPTVMFIRSSKRSESGMYISADYRFAADQPTDVQMRDTASWRQWCLHKQAAMKNATAV